MLAFIERRIKERHAEALRRMMTPPLNTRHSSARDRRLDKHRRRYSEMYLSLTPAGATPVLDAIAQSVDKSTSFVGRREFTGYVPSIAHRFAGSRLALMVDIVREFYQNACVFQHDCVLGDKRALDPLYGTHCGSRVLRCRWAVALPASDHHIARVAHRRR